MMDIHVVLVGGPDAGKTNYLGRLWAALDARAGAIGAAIDPDEIEYVESALAHLHNGGFAPRTEDSRQGALSIALKTVTDPPRSLGVLSVPDIKGEMWKRAVELGELPPEWMATLEAADAAVLFLRVGSKENIVALDWVNSGPFMRHSAEPLPDDLPIQVRICEQIRFIEEKLKRPIDGTKPRLALIVAAWDLVDADRRRSGPRAFVESQFPLVGGRLRDLDAFDVEIFGLSVVGGELEDPTFKTAFFSGNFDDAGWVETVADGKVAISKDLTLPLAWVLRALPQDD